MGEREDNDIGIHYNPPPRSMPASYKPANPVIWGAFLAVIAGATVFLSDALGTPRPDNALLEVPAKAMGAFFGFGAMAAMFRNWINERKGQ